MSMKNFYDDILAICKHLDKQEDNKFAAWQFVASKVATSNLKGSWQLDDEKGGHYFEFHDQKHLYYKNSIMEDRTPPLILEPIKDNEIKQIVDSMIAKFEGAYEPFPDEKRKAVSPLPGFAWLKEE